LKIPVAVGVPDIDIELDDQLAVTPAGKPVAVPIPVAPVVATVIDGVKTVFTSSVGFVDAGDAILSMHGVTVVVVVIGGDPPIAFVASTEKI
jgi:hypothetical protein